MAILCAYGKMLRMSNVTIELTDDLAATLAQLAKLDGASSVEAYLLQLVEDDCAMSRLERTLLERDKGPFVPLDPDWQEKVMRQVLDQVPA